MSNNLSTTSRYQPTPGYPNTSGHPVPFDFTSTAGNTPSLPPPSTAAQTPTMTMQQLLASYGLDTSQPIAPNSNAQTSAAPFLAANGYGTNPSVGQQFNTGANSYVPEQSNSQLGGYLYRPYSDLPSASLVSGSLVPPYTTATPTRPGLQLGPFIPGDFSLANEASRSVAPCPPQVTSPPSASASLTPKPPRKRRSDDVEVAGAEGHVSDDTEYICKWGSTCGMKLNGNQAYLRAHVRDIHAEAVSYKMCEVKHAQVAVPYVKCRWDECRAGLMKVESIGRHIATSHLNSSMVVCSVCQQPLSRGDALSRHKKTKIECMNANAIVCRPSPKRPRLLCVNVSS